MTLLVLALAICPGRALAASDVPLPGMDELTEALPEEAAPILSGVSPEELPQESVWRTLLRTAWEKVRSSAADICRTGGILLCVCVLVSLTDTLDLGSRAPPYITFAAVAVIGTATISDLRSYLSLGRETLQTLSDYSHVLLPVLSSAAAASGAAGSAAAKYAATAGCMDALLSVARSVLVPCVCGYAALSVADAAVGNEILKTAKKIMKTVCTALLSAVCVAIAYRRRYRYGGRARRAGDENGGFRGASGRREYSVGRGLNARSRGRDAQGNDWDLRAACGGGDLPAARFDARRAVFRL